MCIRVYSGVSRVVYFQRICSPSSTDISFTWQRNFQSVVYLQRLSRVLQQKDAFQSPVFFSAYRETEGEDVSGLMENHRLDLFYVSYK